MEMKISVDVPETVPTNRAAATLAEKAYRRLEEMIVTLRLVPGEVLSEAELAKKLKIGRTPIREALQRLAREGLVLILPWRGVLVSEINVKTQLQLLEVRREIERLMARLAAVRASEDERASLRLIAEDMDQAAIAKDEILFVRLDRQLHALWEHATRNEFVTKSMNSMRGLSRRFWYQHCRVVGDLSIMARLHAKIARAIADGAAEEASQAADSLNEYIELCTRAAVDLTQGRRPIPFRQN